MSEKAVTIVIADAYALHREGLRCLLTRRGFEVVGEAADGFEVVNQVRRTEPDIVVLRLPFAGRDDLDTTRDIVALGLASRVVALAGSATEELARRLLRAGARGFIPTSCSADELVDAISCVHRGKMYISAELQQSFAERYFRANGREDGGEEDRLTDREFQVMCLLAAGQSNQEIADKLCLSVKTIDTYRGRVLKKLRLRNNADIARFAVRRNLIES